MVMGHAECSQPSEEQVTYGLLYLGTHGPIKIIPKRSASHQVKIYGSQAGPWHVYE